MKQLHNITVLTVTYNNSQPELERFADGFARAQAAARLAGLAVTLKYVDNGTPSGLDANPKTQGHQLQVQPGGNIGYGPAMAALWAFAFETGADAIVTANPDGAFHPQCINRLAAVAQQNPGNLYEARQFPSEHPKAYDTQTGETAWASGCCVMVTRDVYQLVGNLDAGFWLYMEDVDYSWRVRLNGKQVLHCPQALYAHDVSVRDMSTASLANMWVAARRLAWKWGNTPFKQRCERILAARFAAHFAGEPLPNLGPRPSTVLADGRLPPSALIASVVDFNHGLHFGRARWTL